MCGVAAELALVQCFAIRFLTNPKTIMQSQQTSVINRDSDPPGGRTSPQSDHHGSEGGAQPKTKLFPFFIFYNLVVLGPSPPSDEIDRQHHIARQFARQL